MTAPDGESPVGLMAAVDLGSNSFHMVVARLDHGQLVVVDRLRETVRLLAGLTSDGTLDAASQERARACLRRFGQRLRGIADTRIRAVGTSTWRRAPDVDGFLAVAEEALGHEIEIIPGMEEARLIYLGASQHIEHRPGGVFVVDIGGGSTELIVGRGAQTLCLESLGLGCVELTRRFFPDGHLAPARFIDARLAVRVELRPFAAKFRAAGWTQAVGASGVVRAAVAVAGELGLVEHGVTVAALETILERVVAAREISLLQLPGLGADRAAIFPGGLVILLELMRSFEVDVMDVCDGALREGLLYDMLGRLHADDARERTILSMQRRYHVDGEQAARVGETAAALLDRVAKVWSLDDPHCRRLLGWAARLHEIGLDISHAHYQHHGGYLLANAYLPGFSRLEQLELATLVRFHRRKLTALALGELPTAWRVPVFRLVVLLRLAVLLNRGRDDDVGLPPELEAGPDALTLRWPETWYADNPLTEVDLHQESNWLAARTFALRLFVARAQAGSASVARNLACTATGDTPMDPAGDA